MPALRPEFQLHHLVKHLPVIHKEGQPAALHVKFRKVSAVPIGFQSQHIPIERRHDLHVRRQKPHASVHRFAVH